MSRGSRSERAARWLAEHGGTQDAAAAHFGVSHQAVSQAWIRLYPGHVLPSMASHAERDSQVASMAATGKTAKQISDALGVRPEFVYAICRRLQVTLTKAQDRWAVYQERAVAAARAVDEGASIVEAAIDHNVSRRRVEREMARSGIVANTNGRGRKDGRMARAVARVVAGASVAEACRIERCSTAAVYVRLKRRKNG